MTEVTRTVTVALISTMTRMGANTRLTLTARVFTVARVAQ